LIVETITTEPDTASEGSSRASASETIDHAEVAETSVDGVTTDVAVAAPAPETLAADFGADDFDVDDFDDRSRVAWLELRSTMRRFFTARTERLDGARAPAGIPSILVDPTTWVRPATAGSFAITGEAERDATISAAAMVASPAERGRAEPGPTGR
jgi:hypothetical protein